MKISHTRQAFGWVVASLGMAGLFGCGAPVNSDKDVAAFETAYRTQISGVEYEVDPPDVLAIRAPGRPELDQELQGIHASGQGVNVTLGSNTGATYKVRPDGKIMLYRIGEVHVAGLTPEEIARELTRRYSEYYKDATILVDVAQYNSKFIQVVGQVAKQGRIPYTGRESLLQVLSDSVLLDTAWGERITIVRGHPEEGKVRRLTVDLWDMVENGRARKNVLLSEGDTVWVPAHPISRVAMGVKTLVSPLNPIISPARDVAGIAAAPFTGGASAAAAP